MITENKFKNEKVIKIGEVSILLRPTFENISRLEAELGGVQYLAFKYAQGMEARSKLEKIKFMPQLTECARIIYICQAEKTFTIDEVYEKLQDDFAGVQAGLLQFITGMMGGNKMAPDLSEGVKKNYSKPSRAKKA